MGREIVDGETEISEIRENEKKKEKKNKENKNISSVDFIVPYGLEDDLCDES